MKTSTLKLQIKRTLIVVCSVAGYFHLIPFFPPDRLVMRQPINLPLLFAVTTCHFVMWSVVFWFDQFMVTLLNRTAGTSLIVKSQYHTTVIVALLTGILISITLRFIPNLPVQCQGVSFTTLVLPVELWLFTIALCVTILGYLIPRLFEPRGKHQ